MKSNFKAALDFVLAHECVFLPGYQGDYAHVVAEHNPHDRGGLTKYGIDQRSHPHINIRALTFEQARQIYHDGEWTKCRCDELPAGYDIAVFDIAVVNGMGTAAKMLQRALNDHIDAATALQVDGFIGPKTIAAAERIGAAGFPQLIISRANRFNAIAANDESQHVFLRGWLNRNTDLGLALINYIKKPEGALA